MCFVCGLSLFFNELLYIHNSERHASLRGGNCCTDIQPHGVAVDNIACLLKGSAKTTTPMCVGAVYSKPCERRRCRLRGFLVVCVVVFCLFVLFASTCNDRKVNASASADLRDAPLLQPNVTVFECFGCAVRTWHSLR